MAPLTTLNLVAELIADVRVDVEVQIPTAPGVVAATIICADESAVLVSLTDGDAAELFGGEHWVPVSAIESFEVVR